MIPTGIEFEVCRDIAERQQKGIAKYGTTVSENKGDLRYWLQHAYEESLDHAIYLKRAMQEIDRKNMQEFFASKMNKPEIEEAYNLLKMARLGVKIEADYILETP